MNPSVYESGIRYNAASCVIDSKMLIWGGLNAEGSPASNATYVFDLESNDVFSVFSDTKGLYIRKRPQGFSLNGKFCFMDTWLSDNPKNREIVCSSKGFNKIEYLISNSL